MIWAAKKTGFTLIELLVVVAIVGLLASIIIASVSSARTKASNARNKQQDAIVDHTIGDSKVFEMLFEESGATDGGVASGTGVIKDSSGYNNNGTPIGNPTYSNNTPFGTGFSMKFNGTTQYVSANAPSMGNTAISICAWANITANPSTYTQIIGDSGNDGAIYISSSGTVFSQIVFASNGIQNTARLSVSSGWHLFCNTWSTGYPVRLYMDGALRASTVNITDTLVAWSGVWIGRYISGTYFSGNIDNVRLYDRALDTSEIQKLYAMDADKHGVAFVGKYWSLK